MTTLETDRLILRLPQESDFGHFADMCADPEVMRYISDGQPMAREQAWRSLALIGRVSFWNPEG